MSTNSVIQSILKETNLYRIVGVSKNCSLVELRKGYIKRSRFCHPDKFPDEPLATKAFQKLSEAYRTLTIPKSYQLEYEHDHFNHASISQLDYFQVVQHIYSEIYQGNFDTLLNAIQVLNYTYKLNLEKPNLTLVLKELRGLLIEGELYFELILTYWKRVSQLGTQLKRKPALDLKQKGFIYRQLFWLSFNLMYELFLWLCILSLFSVLIFRRWYRFVHQKKPKAPKRKPKSTLS